MKNDVTEISVNINLFSKKRKAPNIQWNSMEGGGGHLIPSPSLKKILATLWECSLQTGRCARAELHRPVQEGPPISL